MDNIWKSIEHFFVSFTADAALKVLGALAMLLVGMKAIKILMGLLTKSMEKSKLDRGLLGFVNNLLSFVLRFTLIVSLLIYLGVPATSFIAILSSAGLAIGLALQGSLSNFAGGLMLLFFHPFRVGDYIITQSGYEGTVKDISMMYTTLETLDRRRVVLPNAGLSNGAITNNSASPIRRIDISITTDFTADVPTVRRLLEEAASATPDVLSDPPAVASLDKIQDGLLVFTLRCYASTPDWWATLLMVTEKVKNILEVNHIPLRGPLRDVRQI
jgi:small conductance mechanosensitive channel